MRSGSAGDEDGGDNEALGPTVRPPRVPLPSFALRDEAELGDPRVGQVIAGRYRIEELLGRGGMGAVYRATHIHMRKAVAVKLLHREMTSRKQAVARFEREAIAAGRVQHPNVAVATDFGRLPDDTCYLVLEYVPGESLRRVLSTRGPLPARQVVSWLMQVAQALVAAHAQGVVHRDLKPENIIVQPDEGGSGELVKVLDFGLAKLTLDEDDGETAPTLLTRQGLVFGTPKYMSPEQASGKAADERSDLYALGILGYEMLAGQAPFRGEEMLAVLTMHVHQPPPPLPGSVPPDLSLLIGRLLAKAPAERPQTAQAVVEALASVDVGSTASHESSAMALFARCRRASLTTVRRGASWLRPRLVRWRARSALIARQAFAFASARVPVLRHLQREVAVGSVRFALGAWLAAALGMGLLVWGAGAAIYGPVPAARVGLPVVEKDAGAVTPSPITPSSGPSPRIAAIEALPPYQRKLHHWLELGKLQREAGDWRASVSAYRNALQLDKSAGEDPGLLITLRAAVERRKTYENAINVAANQLGAVGLDLLFDFWDAEKGKRQRVLMTELAHKTLAIAYLNKASPALRVRLDLEFAKSGDCDAIGRILRRAVRYADQRSVQVLEALETRTGCGVMNEEDCYPCIRDDDTLALALQTAREQPPPRFTDAGYVPSP